jgi:hypothetical protein
MQFVADQYFRAGLERIEDSRLLYANERYGLSMFVSGLSAECVLRGFCWRRNPVFDARHDLLRLYHDSGIGPALELRLTRRGVDAIAIRAALIELQGARDTLVRLWSNDYRFAPDSQLRSRLRSLGQVHRKAGNQLKPIALAMYNAAKSIIDTGTVLWTSGKK